MQYEWDHAKRLANLKKHDLDFNDAYLVFDGPTVDFEDNRAAYGEPRRVCIGLLPPESIVVVVYVEVVDGEVTRIISMRRAESDEQDEFYSYAGL